MYNICGKYVESQWSVYVFVVREISYYLVTLGSCLAHTDTRRGGGDGCLNLVDFPYKLKTVFFVVLPREGGGGGGGLYCTVHTVKPKYTNKEKKKKKKKRAESFLVK